MARIAWASCRSLAAARLGSLPRMCRSAASRCAPRTCPAVATKVAASSRASRTILSSRKELVMSVVPSEVALVAPTSASVVTMKLVAKDRGVSKREVYQQLLEDGE